MVSKLDNLKTTPSVLVSGPRASEKKKNRNKFIMLNSKNLFGKMDFNFSNVSLGLKKA
jgi:hypothetical protein